MVLELEVPPHLIYVHGWIMCVCFPGTNSYINSFSAEFYIGASALSVFTLSFGLDQPVLF